MALKNPLFVLPHPANYQRWSNSEVVWDLSTAFASGQNDSNGVLLRFHTVHDARCVYPALHCGRIKTESVFYQTSTSPLLDVDDF